MNYSTIVEAYDKLSQEAFAVWIRLHVVSDKQLKAGRSKIAHVLGYSEARSDAVLRELKLAGYITFQPGNRPATPTAITIHKRCKISGRNHFVRLGRFLDSQHREIPIENVYLQLPKPVSQKRQRSKSTGAIGVMDSKICQDALSSYGFGSTVAQEASCENQSFPPFGDGSDLRGLSICKTTKACPEVTGMAIRQKGADENGIVNDTPQLSKDSSRKQLKRVKFYTFDGGIVPISKDTHESEIIGRLRVKSKLDLSKFDPSIRRAKRVLQRENLPRHPSHGRPIDWSRLDQTGKPQITFSPDASERAEMIVLLELDSRSMTTSERKMKKLMEAKLLTVFIRIYETYRRDVMRSRGWDMINYAVQKSERKYAFRAAVACIIKGVTPRQVLEYWHSHIGNFADSKMPVPPLTFLSQPSNIDAVYIALMSEKHGVAPSTNRGAQLKVRSSHTMSDTSLLDPRLRAALTDEGFNMCEINDIYLTTVQAYAIDVTTGATKARLIPSKLRPMVKWAAEHFFNDVNVEDYL